MFSLGRKGWRRASFELAIVFLGVLIALLVDGWNEGRVQRSVERDYLERIATDVDEDAWMLSDLATTLDGKLGAINRLLAGPSSGDDQALLNSIVDASSAGFGVLQGNQTTFEDLRSTGNLGLVSDPALRTEIVAYYESWHFNTARVEARRSTLPLAVYALLPNSAYSADVYFDAPAESVPPDFDRGAVLAFVSSDGGRTALRGEANYARFFRGVVRDLSGQAEERSEAVRRALD